MSGVYNLPREYLSCHFRPSTRTSHSSRPKAMQNLWQTNRIHWYVPFSVRLPDRSHLSISQYILCSEAHSPYPIFVHKQFLSHTQSVRDDTKNGLSTGSFVPKPYFHLHNIHSFRHRYLETAWQYPHLW